LVDNVLDASVAIEKHSQRRNKALHKRRGRNDTRLHHHRMVAEKPGGKKHMQKE